MKLREGITYVARDGQTVRVIKRPYGFFGDNGIPYNEDGTAQGDRPLRDMPEDIVLEVKAHKRG